MASTSGGTSGGTPAPTLPAAQQPLVQRVAPHMDRGLLVLLLGAGLIVAAIIASPGWRQVLLAVWHAALGAGIAPTPVAPGAGVSTGSDPVNTLLIGATAPGVAPSTAGGSHVL